MLALELMFSELNVIILDRFQFLLPYVNILGFAGLRPITIDSSDFVACLGHIQTMLMVVVLTTGYFVQYFSYFR